MPRSTGWCAPAAALLLWAGLLLVTYWWDADGGISDLAGWDDRAHLGRAADRAVVGRPAAGPGAADVPAAAAGARVRTRPAGPHPPGRRLPVLRPDAASTSSRSSLGYAGGRWSQVPADHLGPGHHLRRRAARRSPARSAWSWSSSPASRRPGAGCATSPGTCCTSTPTSASGSPCPTSCGPGRSSSARRPRPLYWWTPVDRRRGARSWSGGSCCRSGRSLRHGLRVTSVVRESSDVVSVYLTGRRLDRLPLRAGQFLNVRFLDGPGWTRANPFSLSAAPDGRSLRITAKALGDGSARLAQPAARHPGAVRGSVRPAEQPGPHPPPGRCSPAPASASPRSGRWPKASTTHRARRSCCSATPASRCSPPSSRCWPPRAACRSSPCPATDAARTRSSGRPPAARRAGRPALLDARPRRPRRLPLRPDRLDRRRRTTRSPRRRPRRPHPHRELWMVILMRRIVIWLASTVTVVVLLFGYHTSTNSTAAAADEQPAPSHPPLVEQLSAASADSVAVGSAAPTPPAAPATTKTYTGDVAQTRWGPVQVEITVADDKITKVTVLQSAQRQPPGHRDQRPSPADPDPGHHRRPEREHRHGQRRHRHQRRLPPVAAVRPRPGRDLRPDDRPRPTPHRRHVEHVMGMPVSLALRGRHADTAAGAARLAAVMAELAEVDRVFSTYRPDSVISRLGRGELDLDHCPPEVAEVLALGQRAEEQSDGAFSILAAGPATRGRRRLDPSGVVKGWAAERASRTSPRSTTPTSASRPAATSSAAPPIRTPRRGGSASSTRTTPRRSSPSSRSAPGRSPPPAPPTAAPTSSTPGPVGRRGRRLGHRHRSLAHLGRHRRHRRVRPRWAGALEAGGETWSPRPITSALVVAPGGEVTRIVPS